MIYIIDTNIIRTLLFHFPKKGKSFEIIWNKIDENIKSGIFISSDECYNELAKQINNKSEEFNWIKKHKEMFKNPTDQESIIICELLVNPKMRESVHRKNILENRPSADLYVAAKAKALGATVVTTEKYKPNSAQLPNLCKELGVDYLSYDAFMEMLDEL